MALLNILKLVNQELECTLNDNRAECCRKRNVQVNLTRLMQKGEFNFYLKDDGPHKQINDDLNKSNLPLFKAKANKRLDELIEKSKLWCMPLVKYAWEGNLCILHLQRLHSISFALRSVESFEIFENIKWENTPSKIFIKTSNLSEYCGLTAFRASLVTSVLKNIHEKMMNIKTVEDECNSILKVIPIDQKKDSATSAHNDITIFTGTVTDNRNNGIHISAKEYISMCAKDFHHMVLQKYGNAEDNIQSFENLTYKCGEAAVKIDLLQIKHTKSILIKTNGISTKVAVFILYNSARIETLLRKFEENVVKGIYPALPNAANIDFALLNEEEEWTFVFNHILLYPNIINRCVDGIDKGKCAPHLLLKFIVGIVNTFSAYYRRKRILLEGRKQLIPLVHARIFLVKCIRTILNRTLDVISVDSIQQF